MAQPSRWVASAAFLVVVPGSIALGYLGYSWGFYPYFAIPIAIGVILVIAFAALFALLPTMRRLES